MDSNKIVFQIDFDYFSELTNNKHYVYFKNRLQLDDFITINIKDSSKQIKVYSAELAMLLTIKGTPAFNTFTKQKIILNHIDLFNNFKTGFFKGQDYFESNYKVNPSTLYGEHSTKFIKDLQLKYFEIGVRVNGIPFKGWQHIKFRYPLIFSEIAIEQYGFFSGLLSSVDNLAIESPELFKTFYNYNVQEETEAISKELSDTKSIIIKAFKELDSVHFQFYAFRNTEDFNSFVDLLDAFFNQKELVYPFKNINLKLRTKTRFIQCLRLIHDELSLSSNLINDTTFIKIIQSIEQFKKDTPSAIYKALIR